MSADYVLNIILRSVHVEYNLHCYHHPCFTSEEIEVQIDEVTCLRFMQLLHSRAGMWSQPAWLQSPRAQPSCALSSGYPLIRGLRGTSDQGFEEDTFSHFLKKEIFSLTSHNQINLRLSTYPFLIVFFFPPCILLIILFKKFLFGGKLLYNVVFVSAKGRHKSVIGIQVSSFLNLPPTPTPSHSFHPVSSHRTPGWAPGIIQQIPTVCLFYIW